jgi:hypothetical protein
MGAIIFIANFSMRKYLLLLCILCVQHVHGQIIAFNLKSDSYFFDESLRDDALSALKIAVRVLNAKEFQDTIKKLDFMYENHCNGCGDNEDGNGKPRIKGKEILDRLYREKNVDLKLVLKKCSYELGHTCPNEYLITSCFGGITRNMPDLPFEYAYAVHICHEYMHQIGYCHTDHKDDIAEAIGEIAYWIVEQWEEKTMKPAPSKFTETNK